MSADSICHAKALTKKKLVWFLALFPFSLFLMEWLVRWLVDDKDSKTFLGPAIASAALGLIAPVAIPKDDLFGFGAKERDRAACFAGVLGIGFGVFSWSFCLALSMKRNLPPDMLALLSVEGWQFSVAIILYMIGVVLTMWKEGL